MILLAQFQSLFLWNALVECDIGDTDGRIFVVSILVFMECSRRGHSMALLPSAIQEFQSLFLWNALVEMFRRSGPSPCIGVSILVFMECSRRVKRGRPPGGGKICFNPCFYGMLS